MRLLRIVCILNGFLYLCLSLSAQTYTFDALYSFKGTPDGSYLAQSDLLDVNGTLYGTTVLVVLSAMGPSSSWIVRTMKLCSTVSLEEQTAASLALASFATRKVTSTVRRLMVAM